LDYHSSVLDNNFSMDLVHSYTIARLALDIVVGDLRALGVVGGGGSGSADGGHLSHGWRWQWEGKRNPHHQQTSLAEAFDGSGNPLASAVGPTASSVLSRQPLRIIAHAGGLNTNNNSAYHRGKRVVKFYFNQQQQRHTAGGGSGGAIVRVYTCRSSDIVAHEVGHAILDSLCPLFYNFRSEGEIAGLHEGFGDIVAICAGVERRDVREYAVGAMLRDILLLHHDSRSGGGEEGVKVPLADEDCGDNDEYSDEEDAVRAERRALTVLGAIFGEEEGTQSSSASPFSSSHRFSLHSPSLSFLTAIGQSYSNTTMVGISTSNLHEGSSNNDGRTRGDEGGSSSSDSDDDGDTVATYNSLPPSVPLSAAASGSTLRRFERLLASPNVLLAPLPSAATHRTSSPPLPPLSLL